MRRFFKSVIVGLLAIASVMSFSVSVAGANPPPPGPPPNPIAEADLPVISAGNGEQVGLLSSIQVSRFYGFSPDNRLLYFVDGKQTMHVWNIAAATSTQTLPLGAGPTVLSSDGKTVYHLNQASVEVWDTESVKQLSSTMLENAPTPTFSLIISPDGKFVGFADSANGDLLLWDTSTGKNLYTIPFNIGSGGAMLFTPDSSGVLLYNTAGDMELVSTADGSVLWTQHSDNINAGQLVFSPDNKILAVVGTFGATDLADMTSGKIEASIAGDRGNTSYSHGAGFSPDNKTLAILMDTGVGKIFDLNGTIQMAVRTDTNYIAGYRSLPVFSPDGTLVTLAIDAGVQVGDVASGKVVGMLNVDPTVLTIRSVTFSLDGKLIALFCADNTAGYGPTVVELWGVDRG